MGTVIKGYLSMGVQGVMETLAPVFEGKTGHTLDLAFNPSAALNKVLLSGEPADVVIGTRPMIDGLTKVGKIAPGSDVDLASSVVGVAVRKGAAKPDISTPEAFKHALLAARRIACSDPTGGGASGVHFVKLIGQLGIADAITPKLRLAPVGHFSAAYLVSGEVDLAIQQISELMVVAGADIVGPLPDALQEKTIFVGGIHAAAAAPEAAKALLDFLRTPEAVAVIKAKGLVPA